MRHKPDRKLANLFVSRGLGVLLIGVLSALFPVAAACGSDTTPVVTVQSTPTTSMKITLRGISIRKSHETRVQALFGQGADDIRLMVDVGDSTGVRRNIYPPVGAPAFQANPGETRSMSQVVFATDSVKGTVSFTVVAVEEDDTSWVVSVVQGGALLVDPSGMTGAIGGKIAPFVAKALGGGNDAVGYYAVTWSASDNWGAARYVGVGEQDLLLTFDVEVNGVVGSRVVQGRTLERTPTAARSTPTSSASTTTPSPTSTVTVVAPVITSLAWRDENGSLLTQIQRGLPVRLTAEGTGRVPSTTEVVIYELDPGSPDDPVATVTMKFSGDVKVWHGVGQWTGVWMPDGAFGFGGDPEYKFVLFDADSPALNVR